MRKLAIISIVVAVIALVVYASDPPPTTLSVVCTSTSVPVQLGGPLTHAKTFVFLGTKGNRTNNAGVVWIQNVSTDDANGIPLQPGQIISFSSGKSMDASDFWIDATVANDGVVAWVQDRP